MNEEKSMILYTEESQLDEVGIIVGGGGVEILVGGGGGMRSWPLKMAQFSKILIMTLYQYSTSSPHFFLHFCFKSFRILISLIELKKCFQKKFSRNILILSQTEAGTDDI